MKRFVSVLFAVVLCLSLSVVSFADNVVDLNSSIGRYLTIDKGDGNTYIGVVPAAIMGNGGISEIYNAWKTHDESYYYMLIAYYHPNYSGFQQFHIAAYPRDAVYTLSRNSSNHIMMDFAGGSRVSYILFIPDCTSSALVDRDLLKHSSSNPSGNPFYASTYAIGHLDTSESSNSYVAILYHNDPKLLPMYDETFGALPITVTRDGALYMIDDIDDEPFAPPPDVDDGSGDGDDDVDGGETGGGSFSPDAPIVIPPVSSSSVGYDLNAWDKVLDAVLPTILKVFWICAPVILIVLGLQVLFIVIRILVLKFLYAKFGDVMREQKTTYRVNENYNYSESHIFNHRDKK